MLNEYISDRIKKAYNYMQNDREKALAIFDEILEIDSENIEALNGKGSTLIKLNRLKEGEKYFDLSLSISKNSPALINKGIIFKQRKEFEKAILYYNLALEANPKLKKIILILKKEIIKSSNEADLRYCNHKAEKLIQDGIKFKNENKLFSAYNSFLKAIENDIRCEKKVNEFTYNIKKTLENEFLYDKSESDLNNTSDKLKMISSRVMRENNNPQKALTLIDIALDLKKNDLDILNHKGGVLFICGDYQNAIECFDKCLIIDENYYYALFNKAIVLRIMNRLPESLNCFDELLKIPQIYDKVNAYHLEILENLKNQNTK